MTVTIFAVILSSGAVNAQIRSVYTSLSDKTCKTLRSNPNEGGDYQGRCPGVGGYKLDLFEGDLRQTIDIIAPNRKSYPLRFGEIVTFNFSAAGDKAEWRVKGAGKNLKPVALIVRLNASEDPEHSEKTTSYLIVSKINGSSACITDIVAPTVADQNARARELADASATKPCLAPKQ